MRLPSRSAFGASCDNGWAFFLQVVVVDEFLGVVDARKIIAEASVSEFQYRWPQANLA